MKALPFVIGGVVVAGIIAVVASKVTTPKTSTSSSTGGTPATFPTDPQQALTQLFALYGATPKTNATSKGKSGRTYHGVLWRFTDPTKPKLVVYISGVDTPTLYAATHDGKAFTTLVNVIADSTAQADVDQILHSL